MRSNRAIIMLVVLLALLSACESKNSRSLSPSTSSSTPQQASSLPAPASSSTSFAQTNAPTVQTNSIVEVVPGPSAASEQFFLFPFFSDGRWGYMNRGGEQVLSPQYEEAGVFSEELAPVRINGKIQYIDRSGKSAFELTGSHLLPHAFQQGVAVVQDGVTSFFVDRMGKKVYASFTDGAMSIGDFSDGLSRISGPNDDGYINLKGQWAFEGRFDQALNFSEGYAAVRKGKKWGFIDTTGKVILDYQFDEADSFQCGWAKVRIGGNWVFVSSQGTQLSTAFQSSGNFSDGLALVQLQGKFGYINKDGATVVEPKFRGAMNFSEGYAFVQEDRLYGVIDTTGKYVIPPRFESAGSPFQAGLSIVNVNGNQAYIDHTGMIVKEFN